MKYIKEYLKDVIRIKPLGELTTKDDILVGMSGEMVYIDGKCADIFISHADYANWLESKYEQKPYGQRKECLDCQFNYAGECKGSCQMKRDEQKLIEWKQENREELTEFENAMMHIGGSFFGENAGLDPNDTAAIKEQAALLLELAPKTEWSEEDEKMLNDIDFTFFEEKSIPNVKYWKFMNWLKFLKERYTWKPSDAQMQALKEACDKRWEPDGLDPLYTLYEQLKKL